MFKLLSKYIACSLVLLFYQLGFSAINPANIMNEIQISSQGLAQKNTDNTQISVSYSGYGKSPKLRSSAQPKNTVQDDFYSKASANTLIGKLSRKGYALVLFFDSTCPHCQKFAPVVKDISNQYGISVYPFSFGGTLPSFPHPTPVTKSIYATYYGTSKPFYPVMFLQNVNTMQFYLVAKGDATESQVTNILNHYAKGLLDV